MRVISDCIRWSVTAFVAFCSGVAFGQAPGEGVRFHHYSQEDGLTQNSVIAIAQDHRGFVWLGTEDGLHRFDGYEMAVYQSTPGDDSGLLSDSIQHLLVAPNGDLLIATYGGGISRLAVKTGEFTHFTHNPDSGAGLRSNYPFRMQLDAEGRLWILSDRGVDRLNLASGEVRQFSAGPESGLSTDDVWSLLVDHAGVIWVGAQDGLFRFDSDAGVFERFGAGEAEYAPLQDRTILALCQTPDDHLLVATKQGVFRLDQERRVIAHHGLEQFGVASENDLRIMRMLVTRSGELWVGTYGQGLFWWDESLQRFRNYRHDPADRWSLSDDVILSMLEDRTGVVWFGTETGGVNKFNSATRAFQHFRHRKNQTDSLPSRVVWAALEDRQGRLWVGTDAGLSRLDRQRGQYTHFRHAEGDERSLSSPHVIALLERSNGEIWAGTHNGLNRLDAATGTFRRYYFQKEADEEIYANSISFAFEADDALWVGTGAGLFRLDPDSGEYEQFTQASTAPNGLPSDYLVVATPARAGGWWLGTEYGAVRFDPATRTFHETLRAGEGGRLSQRYVMDMLEASDGTLWVATDYKLNRLQADGGSESIGREQGLPSNTIYSVLEDGEGDLWIGTNNGLAEYKPATGEVRVYDATDGLQGNEFNAGARFRSRSGEMFFGGIDGLTAFYPSRVGYRTEPPPIGITRLFKFNEESPLPPPGEHLRLSWRDSVVGFEFAVFDFAAPGKNQFRYQLEGFDKQWLNAIGHHHATYTNLDPGEYVLRVRGANRHGVWSEDEARLAISVQPPPWQTWWAYTLYLLTALGLIAGGLRFHFVRLAERHQLENEQHRRRWAETLQQLTQALAASLDGHEVAEELLENLRAMVAFRKAVLFVEQGIDVHVAGAKGVRDEQNALLEAMPATYSRFFAEVRHARKPRIFTRHDVHMNPLHDDMETDAQFLAVPAYSRSDEFALLLIGRDAPPFSEQECDIVSAFLTQALVSIDNARLFAEVQNLATTDTLTQLHNRRYFFELAELEFARGKRYGRDVSLILLDADNFKTINDNYGREIGDRVLKIIANCCRNNLRHFDIIGRYGGEDFVIMLPETPMNVAADVADRLRKSIENVRLDTHAGELRVTVSVGVAVAADDVLDLPTLINRADMALYEAKRAGRNKVVVAQH